MSTAFSQHVHDARGHRHSPVGLTPATAVVSALMLAVLAAVGGWMRRWISDDGLIVLRTVRNLLAGNGPVFNAGERVEANTSTLWQYLIYVGGLLSDARLETIALWLGLILTSSAVFIAAWATAGFYRGRPGLVLAPVGGLIYLAIPAARDFATSGLEWGLCVFWLAVQWALLVSWARRSTPAAEPGRHSLPAPDWITYVLAFWSGMSWLVRPELALYGGLTGLVLLAGTRNHRATVGILLSALPVPAAYQIFRMGYYGLLTPHTAVAKSAADSEWAAGWNYVLDLARPYNLFLALALVAMMAGVLLWRHSASVPAQLAGKSRVRSRATVVALMVGASALHILYVVRVGGDFMHGRMLLLPLFALLLPLTVAPLVDLGSRNRVVDAVLVVSGLGVVAWAWMVLSNGTNHIDMHSYETGDLSVVDEREFWTNATRRQAGDPPRFAEDFLPAPAVGDWEPSVEKAMERDDAQMVQISLRRNPTVYSWTGVPRMEQTSDLNSSPTTAYLLNLGMTGMNSPLNMRVLDTVGLSTPLAARQPRVEDGRIGHDKWLPLAWQAADSDADLAELPSWIEGAEAMKVRAALRTPELAELMASYREPMSRDRFLRNIAFAVGPGRSLQLSQDPAAYLDEATIREIDRLAAEATQDPEAAGRAPGTDAAGGPRIAWPSEIRTDDRWHVTPAAE